MKHVSGKEMCRALERAGWLLHHIDGSHHVYQSPEGTIKVTVPVHANKTQKAGTQPGIMRATGLTDADL